MSLAQNCSNPRIAVDTAAFDSAAARTAAVVDFPERIQSAMYRLASRKYNTALPPLAPQEHLLLGELLRNVRVGDPTVSVRVANLTLGDVLERSARTVIRIKQRLVTKGWIRRDQDQSRVRGMQISDVWLTDQALDALGLRRRRAGEKPSERAGQRHESRSVDASQTAPAEDKLAPEMCRTQRAPLVSHACLTSQSFLKRPLTEDSGEQDGRANTVARIDPKQDAGIEQNGVETRGARVAVSVDAQPERQPSTPSGATQPADQPADISDTPPDLALLRRLGISLAGIRQLMGMATRHGTRLGLIVQAAGALIEVSKKPFAYVRQLILSGRDWGAKCLDATRTEHAEAVQDHARTEERAFVDSVSQGGLHTHAKGEFAWRVIGGVVHQSTAADAKRGGIGHWLPLPELSRLVEAWRAGRIFRAADTPACASPGIAACA